MIITTNKKISKLFFLFIISISSTYSQDLIINKKGDSIIAKVVEIGDEKIKYKKNQNLNGANYLINQKDVFKIIFENGFIEKFENNKFVYPQTLIIDN